VVIFAFVSAQENLDPTLILPTAMLPLVVDRPNRVKNVRSYGYFNYASRSGSKLTDAERKLQEIVNENSYPDLDAVELLARTIKEKRLEKGKIGLDERGIPPEVRAGIVEALPHATFVNAFRLFRKIRMVKTKDEIDLLRKAAAINEEAIQQFLRCINIGVTEKELCREFHHVLIKRGAEKGHWNSSGGARSGALFPPSDYRLKKGDLFRFDVGCTYHNYFADTGGVCVLGQDPHERQKKIYHALRTGVEVAFSLVRPGVRTSRIFETAMDAIRKDGIPEYRRSHLGHGIGLEFYDDPLICSGKDNCSGLFVGAGDTLLEENMVVNIETPYYELGFGGFQIEHTLVTTKAGFEFMIPYQRDLLRVA
jgi:Xaa-Pro dipeptidase